MDTFTKHLLTTLFAIAIGTFAKAQNNVGINNSSPAASAALMVDTTAAGGPQGLLIPRMTQARRNAIASPATGLMVYQTDNTPGFYYYDGSAWTSMAGGSASLPAQTGNAGKVLTTDGSALSWGTSNSYELNVAKTATEAQTTTVGSSLLLPDVVTFSSTNGSSATLTGGNTWNGNKFTVGSTGGGLYFIDVQLISNVVAAIPMLDMNGTGNSGSSAYGIGAIFLTSAQSPHKGRGQLQKMMYLSPGEYFQVRALPSNTASGADLSTDNTTLLRIVRLK